ncbi:hypothetical protein QBC46DRAFT_448799 [Diplogelasinospora grovesii]|uniref:VanZ-like domain-containing protein n=1 Tax=Diplogelasinospora grovesii TaxID=303347 RepID=A0AAN6NAA9_9PEZI|nr:hypothetical protein QBC46DRAFT_448799 [Diplogelasinospora grovesii]
MMRIRLPFAGVFFLLCLVAGYAGLTSIHIESIANDKVLHVVTFFALTIAFYWIIDTNRRRTLNLTLIVCTLCLGVGSEFLQALLPNGREFDVFDLVANVVGSLAGLGLCSWYHKRMLERKRQRKQYNAVPGEDPEGELGDVETDLELGESVTRRSGEQEEGVIFNTPSTTTTDEPVTIAGGGGGGAAVDGRGKKMTLEQEVDNWDENAVDAWGEDDLGDIGTSAPTAGAAGGAAKADDAKKRAG